MDSSKPQQLAPEGRDPILAPILTPFGRIGFEEEIHGEMGLECEAYKPTRYELTVVAEHWFKEVADIWVWWFYFDVAGGPEGRLEPYARMRIERIADVLGAEVLDEISERVWKEQRDRMGEEDWRVFRNGTPEERDAVVAASLRTAKNG